MVQFSICECWYYYIRVNLTMDYAAEEVKIA